MKKVDTPQNSAFRKKAEEQLKKKSLETPSKFSEVEIYKLIHELEVHQIELEMQNHELRLAKAQLEDSFTSYVEIYDFAPIGYLKLSQECEISKLNHIGSKMLGKDRLHLIGSRFDFFVSDDTKPIFHLFFKKVFESKVKEWCQVTLFSYNDLPKQALISGIAIKNKKECLMSMVDITEINEVKKELIIANKELSHQNEEKQKRADELIIANAELEQFASIASHNLQEPLRTISNFVKIMDEKYSGKLDKKAHHYINIINDATHRMTNQLNSLLDFAHLGRNLVLTTVDCKKIIENVISDLETIITTSETRIEVGPMPELNVYEDEFNQLFQNLILNAIKFHRKDILPEILISSEKQNDLWKFSVSDNGIGIEPNNFEKIFVMFQRLNLDSEYNGSGIGLAFCKKIVELHKGKIWVESTIGQGTTICFTIQP